MARATARNDAFGQAIWNQFHGDPLPAILERDDGLFQADMAGTQLYFSPYRKWPPIEKQGLKYVRGAVLDIGCGAGRHALYLQETGHRVTAIDASPLAVALCRKRGVRDARVLTAAQVDRLAPLRFDSAVMFGHNLALLGSVRQARAFLRRMLRVSNPGTRIIGTNVDPYTTTFSDHLQYHRRNRRLGRMIGQLRLRIRYEKLVTPWFDYLFLSREELERVIEGTGWALKAYLPSEGGPNYAAVLERT